MPQSFACLHYHFIFSTKNRAPTISPALQPRLYEYVGGIARANDCILIAAGGMPDHVHLLMRVDKELSPSAIMRLVKTNSSKWVHELDPALRTFAWQDGYGAFTVSYSNLPQVERYVANQEEHHRRVSSQEEFVAFLKRHEIDFDEKYLWT